MANWTWKDAPDLMIRLTNAQNCLDTQDILSVAGWLDSREELERHVVHYEDLIAGRNEDFIIKGGRIRARKTKRAA